MQKILFKHILVFTFALSMFCEAVWCEDATFVRIPIENREVQVVYDSKYQNKTSLTFAEMKQDLEAYIYLLETSYVGYEDAFLRGHDTKVQKQAVLDYFKDVKTIQTKEFAEVLYEAFAPYLQDNHAAIVYGDYQKYFVKQGMTFFSDIFVEKRGNEYFVVQTNQKQIKKGAH